MLRGDMWLRIVRVKVKGWFGELTADYVQKRGALVDMLRGFLFDLHQRRLFINNDL